MRSFLGLGGSGGGGGGGGGGGSGGGGWIFSAGLGGGGGGVVKLVVEVVEGTSQEETSITLYTRHKLTIIFRKTPFIRLTRICGT